MSLADITFLFIVMVTLALVPSTSVALVIARSSTAGFINGGSVAAGIVAGDLIFVLLAVLGMAALAEMTGGLFVILRYIAAAYLIWFGINLLKSKSSSHLATSARPITTLSESFLSGLILTLGDVKAILFYVSFFPAFFDLTTINAWDIATIVALTVVAVGGVKLGYAYAAQRFNLLARGFKGERVVKITAGAFMIGAGSYLLANA